ncbi:MAG: photosynthetic reaction center subunit H [Sphingomonadaceae bacterium]|uniref:photosynthetic reaction center subunit H n=1 Tax=Thermaurantiacus sp. TaxID=2820283 RepID=UPI00298F2AF0|nr:photosynthetic reaction center subunit H [Thermaurantiacus sp.]MCS6987806.1 photosynthetic reaction center subunit H [Sphingomonadaceae bacterium]MDW8414974.1 photosynthetic reaction center subunit H [Thermaurantiacus sp.]
MSQVFIVGGLDVAELVFYLFFLFFLGLVIYLRREDRREGYPLEEEDTGRLLETDSPLQRAPQKSFLLRHGKGLFVPEARANRDPQEIPGTRRSPWPGSPLEPVGDPLTAGVGPGAFQAARDDEPETDREGRPKIVPLGLAPGFRIVEGEPDPRGWPVYGTDGKVAGTVSDIWVDTADHLVRYLAVRLPDDPADALPVLLPITMATVRRDRGVVESDSLPAAAFARAPRPKSPTQVTRREEDRITGFFGAGYLYGSPEKVEPWL